MLITGPPGSGKTELCMRVITEARRRGFRCGGLLTHGAGSSEGTLEAIADGETRPLSATRKTMLGLSGLGLDRATYAWANWRLHEAAQCDLLVVDSIGAWELEAGQGLTALLELTEFPPAVIVVAREGYAEALITALGVEEAPVLILAPGELEQRLGEMCAMLFGAASEASVDG